MTISEHIKKITEEKSKINVINKSYVEGKKELTRNHPLSIYAEWVIQKVSERLNISIEDIKGKSRARPLVLARSYAIGIISDNTKFADYSMVFFNRCRTTWYNSQDVIKQLSTLRKEARIYEELKSLCSISAYNRVDKF